MSNKTIIEASGSQAQIVENSDPLASFKQDMHARLQRIQAHCQHYKTPSAYRSIGQTVLAFLIYFALFGVMIFAALNNMAWLTLLLSVPAGGILVKLFIIQHDCGHGSYFKKKWANTWLGRIVSLLTFTPYAFWRDSHNRHHASSGNLTKRGHGAVDMLTVEEFNALPPKERFFYKLYRHPMIVSVLGPPFYILIVQRFPLKKPPPYSEVYQTIKGSHLTPSVMGLNLMILLFYGSLAWMIGFWTVLLVFVPAVSIAASIGGWLFYVQHQYEHAYWAEQDEWDYSQAALMGSSHYDLPRFFQWVTGNIGFHHIHHLSSLIPNYRLQECYEASQDLQLLPKMSIRDSLKTAKIRLWDANQRKMVALGK